MFTLNYLTMFYYYNLSLVVYSLHNRYNCSDYHRKNFDRTALHHFHGEYSSSLCYSANCDYLLLSRRQEEWRRWQEMFGLTRKPCVCTFLRAFSTMTGPCIVLCSLRFYRNTVSQRYVCAYVWNDPMNLNTPYCIRPRDKRKVFRPNAFEYGS